MSRPDLATEQRVLRALKPLKGNLPSRVLLSLSGGIDSMVMAEILWKWRVGLALELGVAYVHHGPTKDRRQKGYRDEAREFVRRWAAERDLPFFTNARAPQMNSEAEFREFRELKTRAWAAQKNFSAIALAHHQDDLLETRLIRLLRGSGLQGLRAMKVLSKDKFRPLLALSRSEIRAYAEVRKLKWIDDPSNDQIDFLRNWVRREWLPSLESKRPGAVNALARSLESISPRPSQKEFDLAPYVGLRRELLRSVSTLERKALLAQYLRALGLKGYATTHVEEIIKRLDTERGNLTFDMLGLRFNVSNEFLWASRV